MRMALTSIFYVTLATSLAAQQFEGNREGFTITNPKSELYPEEGRKLQAEELERNAKVTIDAVTRRPYTWDWIAYNYYNCSADWNQTCQGTLKIEAPAGWQACKALYSVSGGRNSRSSVTPDNWYTNDPESPDRFRAYNFYIFAQGSGNIFDRWGSNLNMSNLGLRLIAAEARNRDRYIAGCDMPSHD